MRRDQPRPPYIGHHRKGGTHRRQVLLPPRPAAFSYDLHPHDVVGQVDGRLLCWCGATWTDADPGPLADELLT